jgi:hypothetical protein
MTRCSSFLRNDRCELEQGHEPNDIHRRGPVTWGARDLPLPAWRVKANRDYQERGWVAVKATDPA